MTERIRWTEDRNGDLAGEVGTYEPLAFFIGAPLTAGEDWFLSSYLPGQNEKRGYSDNPGDLKAEAERWLAEFVSSLGASFTEPLSDSQRFQVSEARDLLALWDFKRGAVDAHGTERTLADQVRALLAIIDRETAATAAGEED